METIQNIYDLFFPMLQDTEAGNAFFSVSQARNWMNSGVLAIGEHARHLDGHHATSVTAGNSHYDAGSYIFAAWRVEIDGKAIRPISKRRLRESGRTWSTRTGQPKFYYLAEENAGTNTYYIGLWEKTDATYAATTYYQRRPAEFDDTSALYLKPQIPKWALPAVLWYMLSKAYSAETVKRNPELSAFYRMLFDDVVDRLKIRNTSRLNKKWVANSGRGSSRKRDLWDNLPDTIPEPA